MLLPKKAHPSMLDMIDENLLSKTKDLALQAVLDMPEEDIVRRKRGRPRKEVKSIPLLTIVGDSEEPITRKTYVVGTGKYTLAKLPDSGLCECGDVVYTWKGSKNPDIGWYCPNISHGPNGRFWLYNEDVVALGKAPRKRRSKAV